MKLEDNINGLFDLMPQKRILIVADEGESSKRAVMFVADLLGGHTGFSVSLVNFTRIIDDVYKGDDVYKWIRDRRVEKDTLLEKYKQILISAGFLEQNISIETIIESFSSTAQRIIDFQRENNFCILVIGNRELNQQEEILYGSTTKRIINIGKKNCAVWVID